MKTLFITLALLLTSGLSQAQQTDGSLDCATSDQNTKLSFTVGLFGQQLISKVSRVTLGGNDLDLSKNPFTVIRQWVDKNNVNVSIAVPPGTYFSQTLVITTESSYYDTNYTGEINLYGQQKTANDPETLISGPLDMTCTLTPVPTWADKQN